MEIELKSLYTTSSFDTLTFYDGYHDQTLIGDVNAVTGIVEWQYFSSATQEVFITFYSSPTYHHRKQFQLCVYLAGDGQTCDYSGPTTVSPDDTLSGCEITGIVGGTIAFVTLVIIITCVCVTNDKCRCKRARKVCGDRSRVSGRVAATSAGSSASQGQPATTQANHRQIPRPDNVVHSTPADNVPAHIQPGNVPDRTPAMPPENTARPHPTTSVHPGRPVPPNSWVEPPQEDPDGTRGNPVNHSLPTPLIPTAPQVPPISASTRGPQNQLAFIPDGAPLSQVAPLPPYADPPPPYTLTPLVPPPYPGPSQSSQYPTELPPKAQNYDQY